MPRYCRFSARPSRAPTMRIDSSAGLIWRAPCNAASTQRLKLTEVGTPRRGAAYEMPTSRRGFAIAFLGGFVGPHDFRDQRMPHHVARGEEGEADAVDVAQHLDHVAQARTRIARQVDLRDVARHDRCCSEAD